jgi:adenylate cyclase
VNEHLPFSPNSCRGEKEARDEAAEILRISPNFSLEAWRQRLVHKDPEAMARYIDGLRQAGLK